MSLPHQPASKITKLKAGQGLLKKGMVEATALGGQTAIQEGEIDTSAKFGAGIGLVSPILGKVFGAMNNQIKALPDRFVRSALNRSKKEVLKDLTTKPEKTLSQFVLKNKTFKKTANQHIEDSLFEIKKLSNEIDNQLGKIKITKDKIGVKSVIDNVVKNINERGGQTSTIEVKEILLRLAPQVKGSLSKPTMSVKNANKLRQALDKTLGDRGFLTAELPFNKDILRQFDNVLRNTVKEKAPITKPVFEKLSNEIKFRDSLLEKVAQKAGNQILSFGDFIGGGLGGIFGGGIGGAFAGVAARRVIESTPFKFGAAKGIEQLNKLIPIIKKLEPVERGIISEILKGKF